MKKNYRNLSLYHKLLILTFGITFFIVLITGGISLVLQTHEMKSTLTEQVSGLSSLWSSTLDGEVVEQIIKSGESSNPFYQDIYNQVNMINENFHGYKHSAILLPTLVDDKVFVLVASRNCEIYGAKAFSTIEVADTYRETMLKAAQFDQVENSKFFTAQGTRWVVAFSPIKNDAGKTIALLAINADANMIGSFHRKISYYFLVVFLFIAFSVFFIFRWGLNKVLGPVHEIVNGIKEVSNGNFHVKLPVHNESEFGKLSERFNEMTEQLSVLFDRLTITSRQLGKENQEFRQNSKFEDALGEMEHIIQKTTLLKELQRAEKMNAIGQLAASVAHEIRNPMTVVKGFLQIFKSKKELSSEEQMFIKLMIDEMDRAEKIINDYLSLAKPDMESRERVEAGELAKKVMDLMNSYALMSKSITLNLDIEEEVFIHGNHSELKQVLINIFKNGIEAMKEGGTLTLKVYKDDLFGVFEIQDSGIGMTKDELARLGTAFYSLKEKGTGMGLMVCYQIIERMKGKIEVRSEKGRGTTFIVSVPLDGKTHEG